MGKNKYKEIIGLSLGERILRQKELAKRLPPPKKPKKLNEKIDSPGTNVGKSKKKKELTDSKSDRKAESLASKFQKLKKKNISSLSGLTDGKNEKRSKKNGKNGNDDGNREKSTDLAGKSRKDRKKRPASDVDEFSTSANESTKKRKKNRLETDTTAGANAYEGNDLMEPSRPNKEDLKSKMVEKLSGARFRYINEILYTSTGDEAKELFANDPQLFHAYHEGYQSQNRKWPFDPLDNVINQLNRMSSNHVVADLGCGEARLAASVKQKVHSFDLVAVNDRVVATDIAKVPLSDASVDTCVFCLSLMGTNLADYILEANRILKKGGIMKIIEIRSRFESIGYFRRAVEKMGFQLSKHVKLPDDYFVQMDFEKTQDAKKNNAKNLTLKPCLYKKR